MTVRELVGLLSVLPEEWQDAEVVVEGGHIATAAAADVVFPDPERFYESNYGGRCVDLS